MISETAIASLEDLRARGLAPTDADVIRLNALGCSLEGARASRLIDSAYLLPRVAVIAEGVYFREPTVAHEIWFAEARRWLDPTDAQSLLAVNCYALSRAAEELVDPHSPAAIKTAMDAFAREMAPFTRPQLWAALHYALYGCDPMTGESGAARADADGSHAADWEECVACGVLFEGQAVLFGVSVADMRAMTPRRLADLVYRAYNVHNLKVADPVRRAEGAYFSALDEIERRLGGGGAAS